MTNMMKKLEAFFMKEFYEKSIMLVIFTLFLLIPNFDASVIFLLFFSISFLSADINNKKFSTLSALPYSYQEIFVCSLTFTVVYSLLIKLISGVVAGMSVSSIFINLLLPTFIFVIAYWSISLISVQIGGDNLWIPLLIFFLDGVLSNILQRGFNLFRLISPTAQGNLYLSLLFSLSLMILAFYLFTKRGVRK